MKIFYSPAYNISCFGIEKLHPFDSCKYGRAWSLIKKACGAKLNACHGRVLNPVSREALLRVHPAEYLDSLTSSRNIARALEVPLLRKLPWPILDNRVLRPMRFATQGTVLAAEAAIREGHEVVVNMSGGYHHANRDRGEGFCLYNDIYVAIEALRSAGLLERTRDRVFYLDLDAHQGNGVERLANGDDAICIFDMYNADNYPRDRFAKSFIDYDVPLASGTSDEAYLAKLKAELPIALDSGKFRIAFYNAGTDVFAGDQLGGLSLTYEGIYERDRFVFAALAERGIPCVMLPSGGYSEDSHRLIANTVIGLLNG